MIHNTQSERETERDRETERQRQRQRKRETERQREWHIEKNSFWACPLLKVSDWID